MEVFDGFECVALEVCLHVGAVFAFSAIKGSVLPVIQASCLLRVFLGMWTLICSKRLKCFRSKV